MKPPIRWNSLLAWHAAIGFGLGCLLAILGPVAIGVLASWLWDPSSAFDGVPRMIGLHGVVFITLGVAAIAIGIVGGARRLKQSKQTVAVPMLVPAVVVPFVSVPVAILISIGVVTAARPLYLQAGIPQGLILPALIVGAVMALAGAFLASPLAALWARPVKSD